MKQRSLVLTDQETRDKKRGESLNDRVDSVKMTSKPFLASDPGRSKITKSEY